MQWRSVCSLEWMQERQKHLTASDVKALLPVSRTGRSRNVTDMDRLKVYAEKLRILTLDDCVSTGAAARGHILEPYAVKAFNWYAEDHKWPVHFEHWDDVVVGKPTPGMALAYSPDGMNVRIPDGINAFCSTHCHTADSILEIKSYNAAHHMECIATPKEKLEERWQVATAMAADDYINYAWIMFFHPGMKYNGIGLHHYDRGELSDEIGIIKQIEYDWLCYLKQHSSFIQAHARTGNVPMYEDTIVAELEEQMRLNP